MTRFPFWILRWMITALVVMISPQIVSGIEVEGFTSALAFALLLGFLNTFLRPVLVILTFPVTLLTMGLFLLVINAGLFWMVGNLVSGIHIASFGSAFLASLLVTLVSFFLNWSLRSSREELEGPRRFRNVN